jgi:DNA-binding NarL/FixJ family response regulator
MPSPRFHRTPTPTAPTVVLCEPDAARRMAVSALIRKSPHLTLGATPHDDAMLLAVLETDEPADVLCTSDAIRPLRSDRYELLAQVRELRPELPIVYAMGAELPAAVRRAAEQDRVSLVSTRDELGRLHEALVMTAAGRRFMSERLRAVLEDPRLTDRQVEILDRMARGEGRPEIARALGLTEATVRSHTKELYKRLGVNERAHAVAVALRDAVILPPRTGGRRY